VNEKTLLAMSLKNSYLAMLMQNSSVFNIFGSFFYQQLKAACLW
jgi:hypothetical protein